MDSITVLSEVSVNVIMTESFRGQVVAEVQERIKELDHRLYQLAEIFAANVEGQGDSFERQRIAAERERISQRRQELEWRIREAQSLEEGAKLFYRNVQSLITIKPGDVFQDRLSPGIVLKDGVVVEITTGASS